MNRNIVVSVALLLALAAAPGHAASVRDDLGREVSLPQAATRILSLSPHATELVIAAGAESRLIGIPAADDTPDRLHHLPRIGGPGRLDRETLLALRPDLVIAWHTGNRASDLDWIDAAGFALYRSEPGSLQDIAVSIRAIGLLSDTRVPAENSARAFEQAIRTPCTGLPLQAVYLAIWDTPPMTVGGRHWINALLRAAGYRNPFEDIDRGVFPIAREAAFAYAQLPRISLMPSYTDTRQNALASRLSRPGPGLAEAAQLLCKRRLSLPGAG